MVAVRAALSGAVAIALLVSACVPTPPPQAPPFGAPDRPVLRAVAGARIGLLQGTAEWRPDLTSPWTPVAGSFELVAGAAIRTSPQGQAAMSFADGSNVTLDGGSEIGLEVF